MLNYILFVSVKQYTVITTYLKSDFPKNILRNSPMFIIKNTIKLVQR